MKKKYVYDLVFYLIIPLVLWNLTRKSIGDYYAILLTTLPALVYGLYMFFHEKDHTTIGIFILIILLTGRTLDLIVNSAERVLWNDVYINFASVVFWLITIAIKKPMGLYFFLDYSAFKGYSKEQSKALFYSNPLYKYFVLFTLVLLLRDLESAILKGLLIMKYGVEGFNQITVIMTINGYISIAVLAGCIVFLVKKVNKLIPAS